MTEEEKLRHLGGIPETFDWRDYDAVSPVKHQRTCGACYAFSVVANLESLYYVKYGRLINLSEQQILNCAPNGGCKGGTLPATFRYLMKHKDVLGLEKEAPYLARREVCRRVSEPAINVTGIVYAGTTEEDLIASFLINHGVVSIGINGSMFFYYSKGIMNYSEKHCKRSKLNHATNIVGFGISRHGVKYWVVRNTWGPTWGEGGYVRVARGTCGVNQLVMTGVID
jgi:cathepsin F